MKTEIPDHCEVCLSLEIEEFESVDGGSIIIYCEHCGHMEHIILVVRKK